MGLLSDALRWINPPKPKPCDAAHPVFVNELTCWLDHPHPSLNHYDELQGVWWSAAEVHTETGVDW